ncbi:magnesium transporter NIPA-domain-containing protein [Triangularia verruculosa]|uniref:Magnesium transporter NIPA-domain-containing protein n=1 Tax=Triangularia verruculosa TaxID=2587418 RepID=A0AAN6XB35_9PEZI|nr:magnesium transporter NIPA-domain-containing protein [Triangularia verruculosa]
MYLDTPSNPPLAGRAWPSWLPSFSNDGGGGGHGDGDHKDNDLQNWSSLIGIITAICGNVLIALALNVQRYAHIRLHRHKAAMRERARQALKNTSSASQSSGMGSYGAAETSSNGGLSGITEEARDSAETDPLTHSFRSDDSQWSGSSDNDESKIPSTYLKDPYWWLGQVLITVGEMGNFLAYGFAPASIVSPLGVVALVSNCVIAPIFFKEIFRQRDFWGVVIAIAGAVTVVLSADSEETKMGPHEVWDAITTMEFKIYMGVSCGLIALLMYLSPRYGNRTILIDLGLVGLFGGYTALSTKGVSSMLSSTLLGAFTTPVTYALLFVLLFTAIMQVRFLNKSLQRFDSTQVIPIQFVLFTLAVIIGSAVLYRDFERTTKERAVKFIGGCLLTFFGVFLITSGRPRHDDEDEATLSDAEGIEETIGLSHQDPGTSALARTSSRRGSDSAVGRSRRSSRVSFTNKSLAAISKQKPSLINEDDYDEDHEDAPLLGPWRDSTPPNHSLFNHHPGMGIHTISSDSIPSVIPSAAVSDTDHAPLITLGTTPPPIPTILPTTPRSHPHPRIFTTVGVTAGGNPVISPSPFSTTLTAVVTDKLLSHLEGSPTQLLPTHHKRNRPSLRNSLFVPSEEVSDAEQQQQQQQQQQTVSAGVEHANNETGFIRRRARSLSHTLGELLGVSAGSSRAVSQGEEDGGVLARARTSGGEARRGNQSVETL